MKLVAFLILGLGISLSAQAMCPQGSGTPIYPGIPDGTEAQLSSVFRVTGKSIELKDALPDSCQGYPDESNIIGHLQQGQTVMVLDEYATLIIDGRPETLYYYVAPIVDGVVRKNDGGWVPSWSEKLERVNVMDKEGNIDLKKIK